MGDTQNIDITPSTISNGKNEDMNIYFTNLKTGKGEHFCTVPSNSYINGNDAAIVALLQVVTELREMYDRVKKMYDRGREV
jgi:hypothetical protein